MIYKCNHTYAERNRLIFQRGRFYIGTEHPENPTWILFTDCEWSYPFALQTNNPNIEYYLFNYLKPKFAYGK